MKAIVKKEAGYGAELIEVKVPEVGPEQVLIRVEKASICGTDYHIYIWNEWSKKNIKPPQIMGHEVAGEVVRTGERVKKVGVGDYVSAESHIPCGGCYQCQTGKEEICTGMKILGVHTDGIFADYAVIDEINLWKNSPEIPPDFASIQEPLGNAVDTIRAGDVSGKYILITGAGPVGLLAVGVARAFGATRIIVSEPNQYRRELALEMGADLVVDPLSDDLQRVVSEETAGNGVDFTAEMSGHPAALKAGLNSLTPGGRLALLGLYDQEVSLDLTNDIIFKKVQVIGITGRKIFKTWYISSRLIADRRINLEPVITHRFALEDYEQGMELMKSGNCGKILLTP